MRPQYPSGHSRFGPNIKYHEYTILQHIYMLLSLLRLKDSDIIKSLLRLKDSDIIKFFFYLRYFCLFAHSGVQHILCCVFALIKYTHETKYLCSPGNNAESFFLILDFSSVCRMAVYKVEKSNVLMLLQTYWDLELKVSSKSSKLSLLSVLSLWYLQTFLSYKEEYRALIFCTIFEIYLRNLSLWS
jgi:hypothetical protein